MKKKVATYIARQQLIEPGSKVLVALSGGADSVALLRILLSLGYVCEAAHCNFCLRGTESERDEDFVRQLCQEQTVPLHVIHFDTTGEASRKHISIEMAARELRYTWFEQVRQAYGAAAIAVAHHRDDSAETFLLNLLRGTGINGLQGIRPRNGYIIRPLLCLNRQEIITYLATLKQNYVTDSTNLEDTYMRNKIRLHLLPLMQQITPAAKENLLKTAVHLTDAALLYQQAVNEGRKRILLDGGKAIDIKALLHEPAPNTLLFEVLHPLGFNESQIENIYRSLQSQPGKKFSTGKWTVIKDRDQLLIIEEQQKNIPPVLDIQTYDYTPDFNIPHDKHSAAFDTGKLLHPLSLRLWQQGDSFVPFGMKGTKKVSDYLTDRKFSLAQKEQQWVLCCGEDIIWLVGERSDNRFRVNDATQSITIVTLRQPNE
ncbi:tRNA lysidine(34) synthetase TilS [Bacteroides sp. ET71]|uniref:tRNA lysidine(34) synthetase TilS n=1 Tax=Bacteroides sp. ET71 TaxID=2939421 RepID=UPI002012BD27|nr:tRNA lysidine(34) synthetase TilS [Bacteroides sp. ET71]MCL1614860.1 tRNA lysidine(34) synthetase TilS [Bacteroides sp. ET71]